MSCSNSSDAESYATRASKSQKGAPLRVYVSLSLSILVSDGLVIGHLAGHVAENLEDVC